MTNEELNELVANCPVLYHMAERGSWPSIEQYGLLSTSALLDLFEIEGDRRTAIESRRRPESVRIAHSGIGEAVVRDQKPMDDAGLSRCLEDGLTPKDWYEILNARVFFWLTKDRLRRLLNAGSYKDHAHDVIELDTAAIVADHRANITLAPINTGCTKPMPRARGKGTIARIDDYPYAAWKAKGRSKYERVVELAVSPGIPNVRDYVLRVVEMKGDAKLRTIWERPASA